MNDFIFLRPLFLFLFIPFAFICLFLVFKAYKKSPWQKVCSKDLAPHVLSTAKHHLLPYLLVPLTVALLILGLAGPSWSEIEVPVFKEQSGLVIALDLSEAMNAEDVKPSRLKRAIYKINDILNTFKHKQIALIVFSDKPFVVTPLTDDVENIKSQLGSLSTRIMPAKGHRADLAVQKGAELLSGAGVLNGSILLITAEMSDSEMKKAIEIAKESKIKLSILGAGEEGKTAIRQEGGGFLKDKNGALVMTELPQKKLQEIARATQGVYAKLTVDDSDIERLEKGLMAKYVDASKTEEEAGSVNARQDQGYLLVLVALPFILLIFRPGFVLSAGLLLMMPLGVHASYFQSNDKRGEELFHAEEYSQAKELFEHEGWKGCSHYKLGEYNEAAELFKNDKSADGLYNYGTAKAKLQKFDEAIKAYEAALEIDPNHEDAKHNKEVIEEFFRQQPPQDDQKQNDKNKNDKNDKDEKDNKDNKDEKDNKDKDKQDQEGDEDKEPEPEEKEQDDADQDDADQDEPDEKEQELKQQEESAEDDHQKEMDERLLKRVKDDPGELLRRKFLQQYKQQKTK